MIARIGYVRKEKTCSVKAFAWKFRQLWCWLKYRRAGAFPFGCVVIKPIKFSSKRIVLGRKVTIGNAARIEAVTQYNATKYSPAIIIGENVTIEQNLHLTCANKIVIGDNTAIAANVTISDIDHAYADIHLPVERQDLNVKEVIIGVDCKVYNNVVVLPGVHIGKHCVIGANSVVTRNLPDFTVAVGAPARIVKQYDHGCGNWVVVRASLEKDDVSDKTILP